LGSMRHTMRPKSIGHVVGGSEISHPLRSG
jgi:hypothetical protein